jgi:hypothetical protein
MNNRSILLHTLTNNITSYDQIPMNAASGYTKYGFENGRILLSSHLHNLATKITPECIIFTIDASSNITMEQAKLHIYSMILNFQIGTTSIVKIPLSLLFNLKEPQQIGNKIYLDIPFQTFFGDIHICGLSQQDLLFNVERHTDIDELGYITNYELLCKTFLVESNDTRRYIDSSNNIVQQISSISVIVNDDEPLETSSEFIIRTNIFRGFIKGFFIETNEIDGLEEIQFFINDCIRVDFDKHIVNGCSKLTPD